MERLGELAAFGTALCWTTSALVFETASRRTGVFAVNFWKLVIAIFPLALAGLAFRGMPLPLDAPASVWAWLSLSGFVGFVVTDIFLFSAYVMIGSRLTALFLAFSPPFAALIGWLLLGETMPPRALLAMGVVAAGILLAVLGRKGAAAFKPEDKAHATRGYLFAGLAAIGQAAGMVLTKKGLAGYDVVSGTQIRVLVGIAGFAIVSVLFGHGRRVFSEWPRDRVAVRSTAIGAFFGPALGVALSVFALTRTYAGTASTLIGLTPVLIIPPAILIRKERPGALEIVGALVAVGGAALFFL